MANVSKEQKFQNKLAKAKVCSICFRQYEEFCNNAQPINTGRCCNECNGLVVKARINTLSTARLIK
jgi:hypothetical protein